MTITTNFGQRNLGSGKKDPVLGPYRFLYGVCQLTTMGFLTQMNGSARNVCTFFNVH